MCYWDISPTILAHAAVSLHNNHIYLAEVPDMSTVNTGLSFFEQILPHTCVPPLGASPLVYGMTSSWHTNRKRRAWNRDIASGVVPKVLALSFHSHLRWKAILDPISVMPDAAHEFYLAIFHHMIQLGSVHSWLGWVVSNKKQQIDNIPIQFHHFFFKDKGDCFTGQPSRLYKNGRGHIVYKFLHGEPY